eukprot:s163_g8.t1
MEDLRCMVESILQSQLEDSHGFLGGQCWIRFLQIIGGTEQEAQALLQEIPQAQVSVKQFLDLLFGPKNSTSAEVLTAQKSNSTATNNLREYFEKHYREGGEFSHPDYTYDDDAEVWTWMHKPTEIQVWRDAIDLTSGQNGQVFFHYTSELAFGNITHPSKETAEIWASLRTEGPNANAWWGKGIYTVPLPPDQWQSREKLLDNNFRNMMQRDRDSDDPQKGPAYVDREYPKRAAFCVPILIDPVNAFDVSIRATPEMEAAGKEPGRNLGNKLLNESGKPPRCCVVLRVSGEDGVQHARGQLLETLRQRVRLAPADLDAKRRLAEALRLRGFYQEALPVAQDMVAFCEARYGAKSLHALKCSTVLATTQFNMDNFLEAEKLHRRIFDARVKALGPEHKDTVSSMASLATINRNPAEAVRLNRQVIALREKLLGPSHRQTLHTITNLATTLTEMGNLGEAIELHRRALQAREKTLGPEHPETLQSVSHLALALHDRRHFSEALALQRRALGARERYLGPQHPSTRRSVQRIESLLDDMTATTEEEEKALAEIVKFFRQILATREKMLGAQHADTVAAMMVLARSLTAARSYSEAVSLHRQIFEARERTQGLHHPDTLTAKHKLIKALFEMGNYKEAMELHMA